MTIERVDTDLRIVNENGKATEYFEDLWYSIIETVGLLVSGIPVSAEAEPLPTSNTLIYECPAGVESATIIAGSCNNTTGAAVLLSVNLVKDGDAVASTNAYIGLKSIAAASNDPLLEIVGQALSPGDAVYAVSGTVTALNFKISLSEIE